MSYLGLNTTTDDHAAKASPADVRRKNRQLIFRLLFPTNQYSRAGQILVVVATPEV